MTRKGFLQGFLAQFLADAGLFRKRLESAIAEAHADEHVRPLPVRGHSYVFGLDWGRERHYTVISLSDATVPTGIS